MPKTPTRLWLLIVAIAILLVVGLGMWAGGVSPGAGEEQAEVVTTAEKAKLRAEASEPEGDGDAREKPIGDAWKKAQPASDASIADVGEEDRLKPSIKLSLLFQSNCFFGVKGHCQEWRVQAEACESGDADACVNLGEMLIQESPMQPLWGSLFLESACELGRDEACEKGLEWNRWSKFGYRSSWDDDERIPEGLQRACDTGAQVACGLIQMRLAKLGQLDEEAAMASCRAGFRDVCTTISAETHVTSVAIAAYKAGCDIPDAYLCVYLGLLYTSECQDQEPKFACPKPDPEGAEHYIALACELEPEIAQCTLRRLP